MKINRKGINYKRFFLRWHEVPTELIIAQLTRLREISPRTEDISKMLRHLAWILRGRELDNHKFPKHLRFSKDIPPLDRLRIHNMPDDTYTISVLYRQAIMAGKKHLAEMLRSVLLAKGYIYQPCGYDEAGVWRPNRLEKI